MSRLRGPHPLGQGAGRRPDCVAIARRVGFALIVDAKVRADGYSVGTEDRKFFEYVQTTARRLEHEGIARSYLVVVSSASRDSDVAKLERHLADASVRSVVLLTASALMVRVENSIREPYHYSLRDFEAEMFGNKMLSA